MKNALKAELTSLAHQILQYKSVEDLTKLKELTGKLHDKLSILEFAERHFDGLKPTIGQKEILEALETDNGFEDEDVKKAVSAQLSEKLISENVSTEDAPKAEADLDSIKTLEKEEKPRTLSKEEEDYRQRQEKLEALEAKNRFMKNDMENVGGVSYDDLPEFEPINTPEEPKEEIKNEAEIKIENKDDAENKRIKKSTSQNLNSKDSQKPKSLNDKLNKGINIGLNDRLAFIKQLFDNNADDYNRVLSQLNTIETNEKAQEFLSDIVKPDYKNWDGKELYEQRFREIVEKRFG